MAQRVPRSRQRTLIDSTEFDGMQIQLRHASAEVKRDFRQHIENAADMGARATRTAALTHYPYTGRGDPRVPLGARLAGSISTKFTARSAAIVQSGVLIGGKRAAGLPLALDSGLPFEHPVFGSRRTTVVQQGVPYFLSTIELIRPAMVEEVRKTTADIQRRITSPL